VPVVNPETTGQESFIRSQLDPSNAAFIGNKYKPEIQQSGLDLQQGLTGFGDFDYAQGDFGTVTPVEQQGRGVQMGSEYRKATISALAQANAKGMLSSRLADEAVGQAWSRLNTQKRDFMTRYATTVSTSLKNMQSEFTNLTSGLLDLYGKDVQYALDNPILTPDSSALPDADASSDAASPQTAAPTVRQWVGTTKPNLQTIAKGWGIDPGHLAVTVSGDGRYVVRPRRYGSSLTTK
jgi:hypothetical protein